MWECSDEDEWKRLLLPFRKSQVRGNIIIVTTRFPAIARMVKTSDQSIELEGLDRKEFKKLFLSFVFGTEQPRPDHIVLLETGDKILDKLKGNPLAAKTVGRLLRNRLDLNQWERVLQNKEWESEKGDHNIMPALKLSYDYLPFDLQQCFSYCALFPKDYKFDSTELIYFWIALDALQPSGQQKPIEDTGLDTLNHLVSYGFFKKEESYMGRTFYLIHDLLHDLALKVAHECLSIDRSNVGSLQTGASVRHLSITYPSWFRKDEDFLSKLKILKTGLKIGNLQTIMISGNLDECFAHFFGHLLRKASNLRILHMPRMSYSSNVKSMLQNLPIFPHLRYLSLGYIGSAEIHLSSMLSGLYHLKILDLQYCHERGCRDLLRAISSLTKLRHIVPNRDWHHSEIGNVGKLKFLQELKEFEINKKSDGFDLKQLGNLVELRQLGIYGLEKIQTKEEASEAKLRDKNTC
ncbi:hypothetical protein HU200_060097 [Digitaria exilis]|uniref:NB-ARC domain-containing protein n=1 Tax=Digitaria exilis TaxID=1010633 RepID=A0A835A7A8_9POAL|nr:hypothetical protein HU200_060097 [Digitaria exilis]